MKKRLMLFLSCLFLSIGFISAQVTTTVGTVVDESGQPVIGASVVVKGTQLGVSTDIDGKFSIDIPSGKGTLRFSLIGMLAVEHKATSQMRVVMKDDTKVLEEVVVMGYGSGKKVSSITGSVSRVSGDVVEMKPVANAMDLLQGQAPGLKVLSGSGEPGSVSSIKVRGVGSLTAGTEPLIVIDGIASGSEAMLTLNSNDIQNVSVLKDAAATSIYGSRAANGVIYITTKKGKTGKSSVLFSANFGVSDLARRIGNPMNTKENIELMLRNGSTLKTKDEYEKLLASGVDTNWEDFFFSSASSSQYNVSIQGGTDKLSYYLSAGSFDQDGVAIGSTYKKYNIRSNTDAKVNNWLRVGLNLAGYYAKRKTSLFTYQGSNYVAGGIFGTILNPTYYSTDENENGYINGIGYSAKYLSRVRPRSISDAQFSGQEYIELKPIEGLTLKSVAGIEASDYRQTDKVLYDGGHANKTTSVTERFGRKYSLTSTNTIEYRFHINDLHEITFLGGQEAIRYKYDGFSAQTTGQVDSRLTMLQHGTAATLMGANTNIGVLSAGGNNKVEYVYSSFFGQANYGYNDKYFVDLSVRNDGSSRFNKKDRYATFFSGAFMWNAKTENFLKDVSFLSDLKVKLSYGTTGNSDIGFYDYYTLVGTSNYGGNSGFQMSQAGSSSLKWEKQGMTSFTVNAGILNNRLTTELSFYNRKTTDMLLATPLPYTTGFATLTQNVGELSNKGYEILLNATPVLTKDWRLDVSANVSYNRMVIDKLFDGKKEWPLLNESLMYKVGSARTYYMPEFAYIDSQTGEEHWYIPGTNETTTEFDQDALSQDTRKKRDEPYYGGFGFDLKWKNLSLSSQFSWVLGKYMVNNDMYFSHNANFLAQGNNGSKDMITQMWEKPGDTGKIFGKFGTPTQFDTRLLQNASFLRLKDITLSYTLPKNIVECTKIFESVRLYGTARNLFTVTSYNGSDPEIDTNLQYGKYPATRQFVIGVDVRF